MNLVSARNQISRVVNFKRKKRLRTYTYTPYIFIAPTLAFIAVLILYPVIYAFVISFFNWHLLKQVRPFVWLGNYADIFRDRVFWISLKNTVYFVVVYVAFATLFGLALAVLAQRMVPHLRILVRSVCFIPVIAPLVATSMIWIWLYEPKYGILNYFLKFISLGPYRWLISPKSAMNSVIISTLWKSVGFNMAIFVAGLLSIPKMYYDAAKIDGASPIKSFLYITLPMLRDVIVFVLVVGIIGSFRVFTQTYIMTQGGPGTATKTIVLEIYFRAFRYFRMGNASAMAFILFGIILLVTVIQLKVFGKRNI